MVSWVSDWLKQIVLLVLIATFIDLLLPNDRLERYVKLVMGLLIIMAMLSPVFQLLSGDLDLRSFAFLTSDPVMSKEASIEEIQKQGETLKQQQQEWIRQEAEQKTGESLKNELTGRFQAEVEKAEVKLKMSGDEQEIESVMVVLRLGSSTEPGMSRHIEPVDIKVDEKDASLQDKDLDRRRKNLQLDVMHYIERNWNIPKERIHVEVRE